MTKNRRLMQKYWLVFLGMLCASGRLPAQSSDYVGELVGVKGNVFVVFAKPPDRLPAKPRSKPPDKHPGKLHRQIARSDARPPGQNKRVRGTTFLQVRVGDVVTVDRQAAACVFLKNGATYDLPAGQEARIERDAVKTLPGEMPLQPVHTLGQGLLRALQSQNTRFEGKALGGMVRPASGSVFQAYGPAPIGWTYPDRVTLHWRIDAASGSDPQTMRPLQLSLQEGQETLPVFLLHNEEVKPNTTEYPLASKFPKGLRPGALYVWRVEGCGAPCHGSFRVLMPDAVVRVRAAEQEIARLPSALSSDVQDALRAQLYEREGMLSESLEIYRALADKEAGAGPSGANNDSHLQAACLRLQKEIKEWTGGDKRIPAKPRSSDYAR